MRRYILKRLLLGLVTLIGVSIIVFAVSRASGDVALLMAPMGASEELLQEIRAKYDLDKPLPTQYLIFVKNSLRGDFGESIKFERPAMGIVFERFPATLELGGLSFIIGNVIGILLGVFSATRRSRWLEWGGKTFALLGQAIPGFWLAVMFMLIFSVILHWFPTSGMGGPANFVLPVAAMSWFSVSFVMRITRSAILDVLDTEYVKMARIKGVSEWKVIWKHALRNALIPVAAVGGLQMTMLIGGVAFIEQIFRWPGVGYLMIESINSHDYPLIQAIVLVTATAIILINLIVDLLFVYIDPRIKYE